MKWHFLFIFCTLMLLQDDTSAQECSPPIVNSFTQQSSDEVEVKWLDTNGNEETQSYEIRYRQMSLADEVFVEGITDKSTLLGNLQSGQDYELYIRAQCQDDPSEWNGPYRFSTGIENSNPCGLNLAIKDNGCPNRVFFPISVDGVNENQHLATVELTIEHPWPADLSITLISPSGIEIPLVQHKGTFTQNFGTPTSGSCNNPTSFSDLACETLENGVADLRRSFRPLTPLSQVETESNGTWQLSICDRASGDVGILKGAFLSFIESPCQVPTLNQITNITDSTVKVVWDQPTLCNRIVLNIGERGFSVNNGTLIYVDCTEDQFTLLDLDPDTEYDFYIATECQEGVLSPYSCSFPFKTLCSAPIITESFDTQDTCTVLCQTECLLSSNLWSNNEVEDGSEWIPRTGKTPTEFTGPDNDIHTLGSYIYLENQPDICDPNIEAILQSTCVYVIPDNDGCDLEFAYHLYGQDVTSLRLMTTAVGETQSEIWSIEGDQENEWQFTTIDLSEYSGQVITLKFIAMTSTTVFGDIALDQISFIGLDPFDESLLYYRDQDGDGYGNPLETAYGCNLESQGFTQVSGDCDDNNADIHPTGTEVPCNGIDENCNGNTDDLTVSTLNYQITNLEPSICGGQSTGSITIQGSDGNAPYEFVWSNGQSGETLEQIPAGMYIATLTDAVGCTKVTNPIIVPNTDEVSYSVSQLLQPQCNAIQDGLITLLTNCESDCTITWSNGQTGNTITELNAGDYIAVISSEGCLTVTDTISLSYDIAPLAGIQLIRPVTCFGGSDGRIIANSITGSALSYKWSTGGQESTLLDLSAGFYTVTVTDPTTQCSQILSEIEVTQPDPITYVFDEVGNNLCPGDQNAAIQISVSGGTQPYSYNWNTNAFTDDIFQLGAGDYRASITDSKGCGVITETVVIQEPSEIVIEIDAINNTTCVGSNDGSINIAASGGTGQLSYLWNTTQSNTEPEIGDLQLGLYSVTVVDEIGCKTTLRNIPVQSDGLVLDSDLSISDSIGCAGDSTGIITVELANGVAPFNFNWSNGTVNETDQFNDQLDSIGIGSYTVTITDAIGCTSESNSVLLESPTQLTYSVAEVQNLTCHDSDDGSISLLIQGGTGEINLLWNTGDTIPTLTNLTIGSYEVYLIDENDCAVSGSPIQISAPDSLELSNLVTPQMNSTLGTYNGSGIGGKTPYQIEIDGMIIPFSEMPYPLAAGEYEVVLTDNNGCTVIDSILIDLISSTSENTQVKENIIVYPNPSNTQVNVISSSDIKSLTLFTLRGELMSTTENDWIDVSGLGDGVYLCKVETENGVVFKMMTVIH